MSISQRRNVDTVSMRQLEDWVYQRCESHYFDDWRGTLSRHNTAILQTQNGITLWARLDAHNKRFSHYVEVRDFNEFMREFGEVCNFYQDGLPRRYDGAYHIAFRAVIFMGVVWQLGDSRNYPEY
ncbi:hypothetical protein NUW58_g3234 [Xylaria curta]|uniref:Uncharacterized protein n=1 Tax=Xylaria curta TaxID=42375 RepID=A0ACC1PCF4_9PEZI|nr:hypothetical protein NUW58_g3234 [Xylaria curta]